MMQPSSVESKQEDKVNNDAIQKLQSMGFQSESIKIALNVSNNNVEEATQILLNGTTEFKRRQQNKIAQSQSDKIAAKVPKRDYNLIIVMRHSKRIDQYPKFVSNLTWDERLQFERPYDPPIVDYKLPIDKTKELQTMVPDLNITKIVCSPFYRTIQTASIVAKYLNIRHLEIDARIGEDASAINRCILAAKKKRNALKEKAKYNVIANDYRDVTYLNMNEIKKIVNEIVFDGKNNNEEKENEILIEWKHKEKAGNGLNVACAKEYKNVLIEQQKNKGNNNGIINDILLISHGQILSNIFEALTGKILIKTDECGWFCISYNECGKLYSPSAVQPLLLQ